MWKLGVTEVHACNSWSDVCPRKMRPPRIGDIPRHSAVDEELSNSTSNLSIPTTPKELSSPTQNETSDGDPGVYVTQNLSSSLSSLPPYNIVEQHKQPQTSINSLSHPLRKTLPKFSVHKAKSIVENSRIERLSSITNKCKFSRTASHDSNATHGTVVSALLSVTGKLSNIILNINENLRQISTQNSVSNIDKSFDINSTIRKDSAVCLDDSEELTEINNQLLDNFELENETNRDSVLSMNRGIPTVYATSLQPSENECCIGGKKILHDLLPKYHRPRRESSGYFSNLSTFDDDRRNSTTFDTVQSIAASHEKRRSSMKRLNLDKFIRDDVNNERMPSTEIYRKVSTGGLEMPNITELKEIRDESLNCSSSNDDLINISEIDESPVIKTILVKNQRITLDKSTPDIIIKTNYEIEMSKTRELDDITARLCQSTLLADDTYETYNKSSQSNSTASLEPFTDTQSRTNVDSHYQEEQENYKESLSPRQMMTPMRSECCRLNESSTPMSSSQRQRKRMTHSYSSTSSSNSELERILEKPPNTSTYTNLMDSQKIVDDDDDVVVGKRSNENDNVETIKKILPKSVKIYQLLSTQSEDRGDGEPKLMDRRISLQINRHEDEDNQTCEATTSNLEDKHFVHCDSVLIMQIPEHKDNTSTVNSEGSKAHRLSPVRKFSPPSDVCINQRLLGDNGNVSIRPIYPYCPYSPYGSPQGSPRARRRPLRESRRVSIDNRQGALQLNQYKLLDTIGQGSFGIVQLAYNEEDKTHYAMKILSKKKLMKKAGIFGRMAPGRKGAANPLAKVYREIALLKKLDHPNVVKLVEVLDDPDEDNLYLVFELIEKGEVLQLPTDKPLDEETARKNFRDIVLGVEYLHYQRIVHRDIKPSNLLVDSEGHVKVADLGVSAELRASGELLSGSAGTPAFAAPETTILGAQYSGTLCDVWSMGVTLYSLVIGRLPWDGAGSIIGVQSAVRTEPLTFPDQPKLSENLRDLISKMLDKDTTTRINLQEIKTHCWLTNNGKDLLASEMDNCRLPVTVTDEEVARVVTRVPKLDTLILIKTMLKQHSFQNPFLSKKTTKPTQTEAKSNSLKYTSNNGDNKIAQTSAVELTMNKTVQFHKAGRSNSAPDSYDWQTNGRQLSSDTTLASVTESTCLEVEIDK